MGKEFNFHRIALVHQLRFIVACPVAVTPKPWRFKVVRLLDYERRRISGCRLSGNTSVFAGYAATGVQRNVIEAALIVCLSSFLHPF